MERTWTQVGKEHSEGKEDELGNERLIGLVPVAEDA